MKNLFLISLTALCATFVSAQNLGVDYYLLGDYEAAKTFFQKQPATAQTNFYQGEIAFKEGKTADARAFYEKATAADPADLYGKLGLLKLQIKGGDAKLLDKEFKALQKLAKKDVDIAIAIARAYLDNGDYATANLKLEAAKKINKQAPQLYILEGDIMKASGGNEKLGDAAAKYEMSNTFDANYPLGYLKSAQIYEKLNAKLALDLLTRDTELNPDYLLAYRDLGKVNVTNGRYPEAIEAYKKFFAKEQGTADDIERFARAYYFTEQYAQAQEQVDKGLKISPNHYVLNRFNMYIAAKQHNTPDGLPAAAKFFAIRNENPHLPLDYSEYASLLLDAGDQTKAFAEFDKGIAVDTMAFEDQKTREIVAKQRLDLMTKASDAAKQKKNYALAAEYYKQRMAATSSASLLDFTTLTLNYLNAGAITAVDSAVMAGLQTDRTLLAHIADAPSQVPLFANDLAAFTAKYKEFYLGMANDYADSIIARSDEDSYTGYRMKALIANTLKPLDSNASPSEVQGAAKPYYEEVVKKITGKETDLSAQAKQVLLEAYNYLGYYCYLVNDKTASIDYWNKVLELDPANANAKIILDAYAKQGK